VIRTHLTRTFSPTTATAALVLSSLVVATGAAAGTGAASAADRAAGAAAGTAVTGHATGVAGRTAGATAAAATGYVANSAAHTVTAFSIATNNVLATIKVGGAPQQIAITPNGRTAP
jgi:YVTN family beta-propeller protein